MKKNCNRNIEYEVLETTRKLLLRYGVKGWSMDDLAKECCMSKKTFYKYIGNKEELIFRCVSLTIEENISKIKKFVSCDKPYGELLDDFENMFLKIFAPYIIKNVVQLRSYSNRIKKVLKDMNNSKEQLFAEFFDRGKDLGYLNDFVESKSIYQFLCSVIEFNYLKCQSTIELNRKNNLALKIMINGISK